MIKSKVVVLSVIIAFLFFGCKKDLTQFHIDYNTEAFIPSNTPISSPIDIITPEKTTNSSFEFEVNDTRKDLIREILLVDLEIKIISPEDHTFDFLKSVEIFISSENHEEQKIAYKEDVPNGVQKLVCELLDVDLQEYIKEDSFKLRLKTVTDQLLSQDVKVDIFTNFFVDAKLAR